MTMGAPDMCYINLLHDDTLANILSRLMEPINIVHSALACKPWCHVITVHDMLRRHRPPVLCGVFGGGVRQSLFFSPTDQMASPDLAEKTSNVPTAVAKYQPGEQWSIADSLESILLIHTEKYQVNSQMPWIVLAIFNPITGDLQELPPAASCESCFFVGAAILRDDAGSGRCELPGEASDLVFKAVCVVKMPGNEQGELLISTLVHSAGPGDDKWSVLSCVSTLRYLSSKQPTRAGDTLFIDLPLRRQRWGDDSITVTVMMLNMRTGMSSLVLPPPVGQVLPNSCTFVEYGRGGDEKLWFACIHDLLVLRLYSLPKPPPSEETSATNLGGKQWTLERDVLLRERTEDLADAAGELRARNVQSWNGYVFFATDDYGYFGVHLRSMRVQRLSGVEGTYRDRLFPFLCRQDL